MVAMEGALYADLMFQGHRAERRATLRMDDKENEGRSCSSDKNSGWSFPRWLLMGSLLLLGVLLGLTAAVLSYYLQGSSILLYAQEEVETLRTNNSHWLEEVEVAQEYGLWLQNNLSSLQEEHHSLHDKILPLLLYNQTLGLRQLQVLERQRQDLHRNLSKVQDEYKSLKGKNILIPWTSDLLMGCVATDQESAMLCPFCPPGWRIFELSCYLQSEDPHSWEESLSWCRMKGGYLAVVNDEDEQNFLEDLVKNITWIGLSDHHREGNWRWVDGTPYESTIWFWSADQPDNDGDEDCVTLSFASRWNDDKCGQKYKSLCERRADRITVKGDTISN